MLSTRAARSSVRAARVLSMHGAEAAGRWGHARALLRAALRVVECKWWSDEERIFVQFGPAGVHTMTLGIDGTTMSGHRNSDGEGCSAVKR